MEFERIGSLQYFEINSQDEHMGFLLQSAATGMEILPMLKARMGQTLRPEVQSVRYQDSRLTVLLEQAIEPVDISLPDLDRYIADQHRGYRPDDIGFRPLQVREMPLHTELPATAPVWEGIPPLLDFCQQPEIAVELGLVWPASVELFLLREAVTTLRVQKASADSIIRLLIELAEAVASKHGPQLQQRIIDRATADMLHNSAASQLLADSEDSLGDLLGSVFGGIVQGDIRAAVEKQIQQLDETDQLILGLCEPDESLDTWVDNEYGSESTPRHLWEIWLPCEQLIDQMASEVESRVTLPEN